MAIKTNLSVDQGANFLYNVYLIDSDGNPFDISGYSANSQLRTTYTSSSYVTITASVDGANGIVTMSMNSHTTANLTNSRYVYDLELTSNNVTSRIIEGIISVNPGVTR